MIRSDQILKTVAMIQNENLDVRTITLGLNLCDCRHHEVGALCTRLRDKIRRVAGPLVGVCDEVSARYGVPIVNKRLAVSPLADVGAGCEADGFVQLAQALDAAAQDVHVDFVGGYTAQVEKGATDADSALIEAMPRALLTTRKVCASLNVASTKAGVNMDVIGRIGFLLKEMAAGSADRDGLACAKLVVFANQPQDNPFMAGAYHGHGEPEAVINVGVSGPGVVARALERRIAQSGADSLGLDELAEEIKQTSFRVTRCGEILGREVARRMGVPFGVVDLSLAPTPKVGDSVGEILKILGMDAIGAPGSTACVALLNDAVKKGGAFASQSVGGLSGAFIPVCEDAVLAEAAGAGHLSLEKLEAMTSVCSVGLDMIAVPGDTPAETLAALIADEMAIGVVNRKTTAVRIIPVPGKKAGERAVFGGLFGQSAILDIRNPGKSARFVRFGGRIPAPIHSLNN
ncbi:MAG: hypothetical protein BWZ02_01646 [Lentisphaerae bacterium ADurb.BinA184]|nr:MAG: hypothetical protein BWZ02_01646 [Lentisphaerae bacterium ADurb.BinA184]